MKKIVLLATILLSVSTTVEAKKEIRYFEYPLPSADAMERGASCVTEKEWLEIMMDANDLSLKQAKADLKKGIKDGTYTVLYDYNCVPRYDANNNPIPNERRVEEDYGD